MSPQPLLKFADKALKVRGWGGGVKRGGGKRGEKGERRAGVRRSEEGGSEEE
jgi:hypothetical protein